MARAATFSTFSRASAALAGVLLACTVVGCSAARKVPLPTEGESFDPCANPAFETQIQELITSRQQRSGDDASYAVAAGDVLVVTVYNYRPEGGDFSSDVRVDDRGSISLPMMDPIRVRGLSVTQVKHAIVAGLRRAEVLNEPLVSVFVKDYQGQEVVVLGAVARPGMFHLSRGKQTLVDLVSMAGGLTPTAGNFVLVRPVASTAGASLAQAYAIHSDAVGDPAMRADGGNIPVCLATAGGQPNPAVLMLQVRGGDLVIVPEAGKAFIEGEVDKPGPYQLTHGMTLMQLISSAGGMLYPADPTRIRLIRRTMTGDSMEIEVNLENREAELQRDVQLTRDDRVVVPYTTGRKAAYGMYQFVTAIVRISVGGAASIF